MIRGILRMFSNNPYETGPDAFYRFFLWKRTFTGKTDCGFKFQYSARCHVAKISQEEFKAARMLEESRQQEFLEEWHNRIFLPKVQSDVGELSCARAGFQPRSCAAPNFP